jgi:cytochrome P450
VTPSDSNCSKCCSGGSTSLTEDHLRDTLDRQSRELVAHRRAVKAIREALSTRMLAAADDDDMTPPEALILGQIVGILKGLE